MINKTVPVQETAAVVVIFYPDQKLLAATVRSLVGQVGAIIIVDNTPHSEGERVARLASDLGGGDRQYYLPLNKNSGIGHAQNCGIQLARQRGYAYALLSDQDTEFPAECVTVLLRAHAELTRKGERVAAVAPAYVNAHAVDEPPSFTGLGPYWRDCVRAPDGAHEVSAVIASGTLIDLACIDDVGLMNESLFIDWVDFEWCWRARAVGWKVYGVFDVTLRHHLGDRVVRVFQRVFSVHSPLRNYYITRNGIYLSLYSKVLPWRPRLALVYRVLRIAIVSVAIPPRLENLRMALTGFRDGLIGVLGER